MYTDPAFLIPYSMSVILWVGIGVGLCTMRHRKRGIETDTIQTFDPSPQDSLVG
jgi:hypothetical protein